MTDLQKIIDNLKSKQEVDALLIAGSFGKGEENSYSDIDIVVIFKENLQNLKSLFQWIDKKPADIYFFDHSDIEKLFTLETIPSNKMDAVLIDWLVNSNIQFDKSGILTKLKNKADELKKKFSVPTSEMKSFEEKINYGYTTTKRYFDSNNPLYHEALEIKLLYEISNALVGYFEFRNIPWRGEKFAITYLKNNDFVFYENFLKSIGKYNLKERFEAYEKMVKSVFVGNFDLWNKDKVVPFTKEQISPEESKKLLEYWGNLIGK